MVIVTYKPSYDTSFFFLFRRDSEDVMELLTMIADNSDFSSDSEEDDDLEWLYIKILFCNNKYFVVDQRPSKIRHFEVDSLYDRQ